MLQSFKTFFRVQSVKMLCITLFTVGAQGATTHLFSQAPDSLTGMKGFVMSVGNNYSLAFKY